jgi:hypothetical protein
MFKIGCFARSCRLTTFARRRSRGGPDRMFTYEADAIIDKIVETLLFVNNSSVMDRFVVKKPRLDVETNLSQAVTVSVVSD